VLNNWHPKMIRGVMKECHFYPFSSSVRSGAPMHRERGQHRTSDPQEHGFLKVHMVWTHRQLSEISYRLQFSRVKRIQVHIIWVTSSRSTIFTLSTQQAINHSSPPPFEGALFSNRAKSAMAVPENRIFWVNSTSWHYCLNSTQSGGSR